MFTMDVSEDPQLGARSSGRPGRRLGARSRLEGGSREGAGRELASPGTEADRRLA